MKNNVKISCKDVWKIFGKGAEKVISASPSDRKSIADALNCTIAVCENTFEVKEGEVFVIMGLSGSGKSTILRCINYLHKPTQGQVLVDGEELGNLTKTKMRKIRQNKMGMVFQHFALLPHRSVLENTAFGLEIQGLPIKDRHKRAREGLDLVGLSEWENHYPHELSGGMQQRVGLARALALNPEILLMDEAFSALDPLIRKEMQDEFLKLVAIVKKTIVFITHDLDEALKLADRIAVMKDGRIVQIGTPEEIVMDPGDEYVADFVSSVSRTKVISARNLMVSPDKWISAEGEDPIATLNRMRKNDADNIFILDSANRLIGVVDKKRVFETIKEDIEGLEPIPDIKFESVLPNTNLEDLLSKASKTKYPIPVTDKKDRLVGVISRSKLLRELSKVI